MLTGAARLPWSDSLVELAATLLSVYLYRGDLLRARQFAAELLNAADALGTPRSIVAANWNALLVAHTTGHNEEALSFAERAMAVQAETGQPRSLARMRGAMLQVRLRARPSEARAIRDQLRASVVEFEQTSTSAVDRARMHVELASAEFMSEEFDKAVEHAVIGLNLIPEFKNALGAEAGLLLGRVYGTVGREQEAASHVASVRDWLTPLPDSRRSASTWYATAETMESLGDTDGAVEAYQRALACAGL
jgi:tetratricopeptide (TPR) repeat protein